MPFRHSPTSPCDDVPNDAEASSHRIRIRCSECDGAGYYTLAYSLDPYAKTYRCEECDGEGFIEVELEELEA